MSISLITFRSVIHAIPAATDWIRQGALFDGCQISIENSWTETHAKRRDLIRPFLFKISIENEVCLMFATVIRTRHGWSAKIDPVASPCRVPEIRKLITHQHSQELPSDA
jgi:hypothetical protein